MFHLTGQALWSPLSPCLHRQFNISENAASFVQKTLGRADKITAVSPSGLSCELWDPYHDLSQWHSPDAPQDFKWNCFHLNHRKPSQRGVVFWTKLIPYMNKLYHDRLLYFWTKLIGCFPPATPVSVLPGYPVTWTHNLFGHKTPATENNGQRKQSHYLQSNDKKPISGQFLAYKNYIKRYTIH